MTKFIKWLKKYHIIHSWGKWQLQKITVHHPQYPDLKSDIQVRSCEIYNKMETISFDV